MSDIIKIGDRGHAVEFFENGTIMLLIRKRDVISYQPAEAAELAKAIMDRNPSAFMRQARAAIAAMEHYTHLLYCDEANSDDVEKMYELEAAYKAAKEAP